MTGARATFLLLNGAAVLAAVLFAVAAHGTRVARLLWLAALSGYLVAIHSAVLGSGVAAWLSPAGAGLAILPMIISFQVDGSDAFESQVQAVILNPAVLAGWMLLVAYMMVGNFPTFSTKQLRVPYKMKVPALAVFSILIVGLINAPWPTLTILAFVYLLLMPFGVLHYARKKKSLAQGVKDPDDHDEE